MEWTEELREIRSGYTAERMQDAIDHLSVRARHNVIVSAFDITLNQEQMNAFYNLAASLGGIVIDQAIRVQKSPEELEWTACDMERLRRKNP